MSFKCSVCGKAPSTGNTISHSHVATKRIFRPNLQSIRVMVKGKPKRQYVCTRCLRSNKVQKAV